MTTIWATCGTPGCISQGTPIRVDEPETIVVCGACGQLVINVSETAPEPVTEVPEWLL